MGTFKVKKTQKGFHYIVVEGRRRYLSKNAQKAFLEGYNGEYELFDVVEDANGKPLKKPFTVVIVADATVGEIKLV